MLLWRVAGKAAGERQVAVYGFSRPKLLLLDEPSEGLSPLILSGVVDAIRKLGAEGMTILIADHNLKFARRLAEYAYIVENGTIRHQGAMEELLEDGETVRKYLAV